MKCGFFDLVCHAQSAAQGAAFQAQLAVYEWWASVSWVNKALIIVGLWFLALYLTRGIISIAHRIGGWKAAVGYAVAALGAVVWLFLKFQPKRPKGDDDFTGEVDGEDARRSPRFRVPPLRRKGKRRFNPDTALWEDIK